MPDNVVDRVGSLIEAVRFWMLSTWNGHELRSRPMGAFVRRDEGAIYFFSDERAHADDEIRQYPQVNVAFADPHAQKYVAVSGTAEVGADRAKIRELWSVPTRFWWDSPDDPHIRLIKVTPHRRPGELPQQPEGDVRTSHWNPSQLGRAQEGGDVRTLRSPH